MKTETLVPSYAAGLAQLRNYIETNIPADVLSTFDNDADALERIHQSILTSQVGDPAPLFVLNNATNDKVDLSAVLKEQRVVLVFYRGAWCPYCNLQLQQYQQSLPEMQALGAQLIAISPQTPDASLDLKEKSELKFEVLSDLGNQVARQYTTVFKNEKAAIEAMAALGYDFHSFYSDDAAELPVPAVFIIEKDGTISFAKSAGGDYRNRVEAQEIINALKK